ncbi:hypothetical protein X975_07733, partial [Stegodyphus mimosarum]
MENNWHAIAEKVPILCQNTYIRITLLYKSKVALSRHEKFNLNFVVLPSRKGDIELLHPIIS